MIRALILPASLLATAAVAQTPPAPDPAQLAIGRSIAAELLPNGSYQRMMNGTLDRIMEGMTQQMMSMPMAQIVRMAGLPPTEVQKMGSATMRQVMEIVDPAFEQRMHIMMPIMMGQIGQMMGHYEPAMREGLAEAYARHLSLAQLTDLDRFLHTPSGSAYAAQAMLIQTDPAVMQKMQAFLPEILKAMPDIMEKVQAATANLPKPKTAANLTDADRAKLAQLLGVDPAKLKPTPKEPAS